MKTKTVLITLLALCFLVGGAGCNRDNPYEEIKIKDFSYQGCKEIVTSFTKSAESEESIEYRAIGDGFLRIKHVNAVFNCCPGTIKSDLSVVGNTITIVETETDPQCKCICDYDLEYTLGPLSSNTEYILIFCNNKGEYLRFSIKYKSFLEGKVIVKKFKG
jgi:hypothetical protein